MPKRLEVFLFKGYSESPLQTKAYEVLFSNLDRLTKRLSKYAQRGGEINIVLEDGRTIRGLNKRFRGIDSATDVLSFPLEHGLGEVWISPNVIQTNADKFGVSFDEELLRIAVHGILHLLGYDHKKPFDGKKKQTEEMYIIQEEILK